LKNGGRAGSVDKRSVRGWGILMTMTPISYPILSRGLYAAVWLLALPLLCLHLLYRSLAQPAYRRHMAERFGFYPAGVTQPIWLHAASLGEVQAATALLKALRQSHPNSPLLISCQTPAGRQAAEGLRLDNCTVCYLPFDTGFLARRFIRHFQPRIALVVETEIWPILFLTVQQRQIPLFIINARMTERSLRRYLRFRIFRYALSLPQQIICQSDADAERYRRAGAIASTVSVSGNLKWDMPMDDGQLQRDLLRRKQWPQSPVWMAASTHAQEEAAVLDTHRAVLKQWPNALLLWAPRHPERFTEVMAQVTAAELRCTQRTVHGEPDADTQVFVIDTLGEMARFLPGIDAVFVGGSLQPVGGHNVWEPAMAGIPVLVGPHTANFAESVAALHVAGALQKVADANALPSAVLQLLADAGERVKMSLAARACVQGSYGALEKTKALIAQRLD